MKKKWQKEAVMSGLADFLRENRRVAVVILGALIATIVYYFRYKTFVYVEFDAINLPLLPRIFLSAFGFFTIGAFLYHIKFYYFLWQICKRFFDSYLYRQIKSVVWIFVIFIAWACIQIIIDFVNKIIEIAYNVSAFLLFFN